MSIFRKHPRNIIKDFKLGKEDAYFIILNWCIFSIVSSVYLVLVILLYTLTYLGYIDKAYIPICVCLLVVYNTFLFNKKAKNLIEPLAWKIVMYFAKYGGVVTREDWKRIKKSSNGMYKILTSDKSRGYCYFMSRYIALYLKDVELLYCSMDIYGRISAHAVIKKGNCIYCTNARMHLDYDEWIKSNSVEVYRTFSREEYVSKEFFDNINGDFVEWCKERDVYCSPQKSPVPF